MASRDYKVGYGKPPQTGQFKKGQSGNPCGRRQGSKNLSILIEQELDQRLVITENGKRKIITKREAVAKQVVNSAVGGDHKAIPLVLNESRQSHAAAEDQPCASTTSDEDLKVILGALRRLGPEVSDDEA